MGDTCTRACRFCNVKTSRIPAPLDPDEPKKTAAAIKEWNIDYVVVTSVDRDDLEDFGSEHFAETIREIRMAKPKLILEVLIPDFQGREDLLAKIVRSKPHVISHNLETIQRLQGNVRDYRASYERSLNVLKSVKSLSNNSIVSKTSLMLGLGETDEELKICFSDLRKTAVDCLTLGQYMRPSSKHLKVKEYVRPEKFKFWKEYGKKIGFIYVASGPNVRSSYKAGEYYLKNLIDN